MMNSDDSILFVANVQGADLIKRRGIRRNLSIAGNTKVFGICAALSNTNRTIGVYSPGTAAERTGRFHSATTERVGSNAIPVWYGATGDNRVFRFGIELIALITTLPNLIKKQQAGIIIVYNLSLLTLAAAVIAKLHGCKLILEYEDSALAARTQRPPLWKKLFRLQEILMRKWCFGVYAPSPELLDAVGSANRLLLPGVLNSALVHASVESKMRPDLPEISPDAPLKLLYSGGLDKSKGIDRFLKAAEQIKTPLEIHICGTGPLADEVKVLCERSRHKAIFHGLVEQNQLTSLQTHCHVGLNPHRSDLHGGGVWPFKVVEYIAGCGTVFCCRTGRVPEDLARHLYLYDGDSVENIVVALRDFIARWPELSAEAATRREWAIEQFGPAAVARKLESLFAGTVPTEWQGL